MSLNISCKHYLSVIAISFAALSTLAPTPAHARGALIVNTGEELFEVADFPQNMVDEYPGLKNYKISYACQRFGVFWANIWTWDCKLMAGNLSTNTAANIPQEFIPTLQQQYPFDKAQRNLWNKYGIVTMLGIFILLGVIGAKAKSPDTETQPQTAPQNEASK